jgi:hypothetical protein
METIIATIRNGQLELREPVNWPDGTMVSVTPLPSAGERVAWLSLPPLDLGEMLPLPDDADLLGEMLDGKRF